MAIPLAHEEVVAFSLRTTSLFLGILYATKLTHAAVVVGFRLADLCRVCSGNVAIEGSEPLLSILKAHHRIPSPAASYRRVRRRLLLVCLVLVFDGYASL